MIVSMKQVQCSKAGCSKQFWIEEAWEGLFWCSDECHSAELEGPTIVVAAAAADAEEAAAIAAFENESPSAGVSLEGGMDATTDTGSVPSDILHVDDGV